MARLGSITSATDITAGGGLTLEEVQDAVAAMVTAGTNVTKAYDDTAGTLTISATGGGGATQALMETRTLAAAATIDVAVKSLRTAGYSTVGDRGDALYKRVNALPAHSGYFRSVDRFTAAGATDATNGGYWELVPHMGAICIEQFGGKADYVPAGGNWGSTGVGTGTNNYTAWVAMMTMTDRIVGNQEFCPRHMYRAGAYSFGQTLIHTKVVSIQGIGSGRDAIGGGEGTIFVFPENTTCMVFHSATSGPGETEARSPGPNGTSAGGSIIEGFALFNEGAWPNSNRTKHALRLRTRIVARNIGIYKTGGDGVHLWAQNSVGGAVEGVANDWHLENIQIMNGGGNGFYVRGNDANAGRGIGLETKGDAAENGCGLYDESGLGNVYVGCNFAGYGNSGVHRAGRWYVYLASKEMETGGVTGGNTTPGTNDKVWMDIGAAGPNTQFPEWVSGATYNLQLPVWIGGLSNRSVINYIYVEGWMPCHVEPPSIAIQGQCGFTRYSAAFQTQIGQGPFTPVGIGGQQAAIAGQPRHTYNGGNAYTYVGSVAAQDSDQGMCLLQHNREREGGAPFEWRYLDGEIVYGRASTKPFWKQSTSATPVAKFPGRTSSIPSMMTHYDPMLQDANNAWAHIVIGVREAVPTAGEWRRGDRVFKLDVSAGGNEGWVCVTSGSPGTWKEFGTIQA